MCHTHEIAQGTEHNAGTSANTNGAWSRNFRWCECRPCWRAWSPAAGSPRAAGGRTPWGLGGCRSARRRGPRLPARPTPPPGPKGVRPCRRRSRRKMPVWSRRRGRHTRGRDRAGRRQTPAARSQVQHTRCRMLPPTVAMFTDLWGGFGLQRLTDERQCRQCVQQAGANVEVDGAGLAVDPQGDSAGQRTVGVGGCGCARAGPMTGTAARTAPAATLPVSNVRRLLPSRCSIGSGRGRPSRSLAFFLPLTGTSPSD